MIIDNAKQLESRLIEFRRAFHMYPELGFQEIETGKKICAILKDANISFETGFAKTGIVATIGSGKPTVALRADMDALPVAEANEVDYKSKNNGKMHACGHDAHMACLLGAAILLKKEFSDNNINGTVKLVFQPCEESKDANRQSGSMLMVEEGVFNDVDAVIALHVESTMTNGALFIRPGAMTAAVDRIDGKVLGKGGHGAYPHQAIDPIWLSSNVLNTIYGILPRCIDATQPAVISICTIHAGSTWNVIPEFVELSGTVRTFDEEVRQKIHKEIEQAFQIAKVMGGDYELLIDRGHPSVINAPNLVAKVEEVATHVLGSENVKLVGLQMGAEDFSHITRIKPSAYFYLGAKKDNINRPHHSSNFDIDESVLYKGAALLTEIATELLCQESK
mgnify:CR=1 FL=1